jgi:hypothetical protein
MGLNSEQEKRSLKESLRNTENLNDTVFCLEHILKHRTPFALYVATADRSDCTWIFDPDTIYEMLGGEHKYKDIFNSLFTTEEEQETGVIFFIFKKVGPFYSVRIELELIDEIINELYDEL